MQETERVLKEPIKTARGQGKCSSYCFSSVASVLSDFSGDALFVEATCVGASLVDRVVCVGVPSVDAVCTCVPFADFVCVDASISARFDDGAFVSVRFSFGISVSTPFDVSASISGTCTAIIISSYLFSSEDNTSCPSAEHAYFMVFYTAEFTLVAGDERLVVGIFDHLRS